MFYENDFPQTDSFQMLRGDVARFSTCDVHIMTKAHDFKGSSATYMIDELRVKKVRQRLDIMYFGSTRTAHFDVSAIVVYIDFLFDIDEQVILEGSVKEIDVVLRKCRREFEWVALMIRTVRRGRTR